MAANESQLLTRVMGLLRIVAAGPATGMRASQIAEESGLHLATTHRLLGSMQQEGLLRRLENKHFTLGPEIWMLGQIAVESFDLRSLVAPSLDRLSKNPGDVAFLQFRAGNTAVCLERLDGPYPIRPMSLQTGERRPLGVGAGSLALLAALDDAEIEDILSADRDRTERYPRFTDEWLRQGIRDAREKGYTKVVGEVVDEMWAFGVPIRDSQGRLIASLSCAAVRSRLQTHSEEAVASLLHAEAALISCLFQSTRSPPTEGEQR